MECCKAMERASPLARRQGGRSAGSTCRRFDHRRAPKGRPLTRAAAAADQTAEGLSCTAT